MRQRITLSRAFLTSQRGRWPSGIVEHMFDRVSDFGSRRGDGCSRRAHESTAIAQRLLAVAELYVRHEGALADLDWYVVDYCAATAAEVSAVQNISHARAVGQVQFACALAHRLPAVAQVFLRGTIDLRMVSMIIARTDNVEDALMGELDAAIARHCREVDETVQTQAAGSGGSVGGQVRSGRGTDPAQGRRQPLCRRRAGQPGDGVGSQVTCMPPTPPR